MILSRDTDGFGKCPGSASPDEGCRAFRDADSSRSTWATNGDGR